MTSLNLLFDADDTLWENNILFEAVIESVLVELARDEAERAALRARLDRIERENIRVHGYGCAVFERSLADFLADVRQTPCGEEELAWIRQLCRPIWDSEIELLPGVRATLEALAARHRLFLLTKGAIDEQQRKISASGLADLFEAIEIVVDKTADAYEAFLARYGLERRHTWMIGNSPRSDVLPALAVDLGSVLVPHPATWSLEQAAVPAVSARFAVVERFTQLVELFGEQIAQDFTDGYGDYEDYGDYGDYDIPEQRAS